MWEYCELYSDVLAGSRCVSQAVTLAPKQMLRSEERFARVLVYTNGFGVEFLCLWNSGLLAGLVVVVQKGCPSKKLFSSISKALLHVSGGLLYFPVYPLWNSS